MKKLLFISLFFSLHQHAQINRFAYTYEFKPDSTNRAETKKEIMFLDISEKGSRFHSHERMVQDSIMRENIKKQIASGTRNVSVNRQGNRGQFFEYVIEKSYPDYKIDMITRLGTGMDHYKISSQQKFNWKIEPETSKIGNYEVQKATTNFGGRKWIAWFTTEIPFQEGPYKFCGLPGMILKIEDSKGDHTFTFSGNKTIENLPEEDKSSINPFHKTPIDVTEEKFTKIWENWKADPMSEMRQMMGREGVTMRVSVQGKEITDPNEMIRNAEKRIKELIKSNNNPIELNLYK